MEEFKDTHFAFPKKYTLKKEVFLCTKEMIGIVCNSGRLDYSALRIILGKGAKVECNGNIKIRNY